MSIRTAYHNVPGLLTLIFFLCTNPFQSCVAKTKDTRTPTDGLRHLAANLTSIHFIGDLHADVDCAKEWVKLTGLVDLSTKPYKWIGEPTDAIVFLGDYVDKGSFSSSVLYFVKELQTTFSNNVMGILGNHDFFQVLDAALDYDDENPHPLTHPQHDYVYSYVHPEEYVESGFSPARDDDAEIMKAIHEALQYVYDRRLEGDYKFCATESCINKAKNPHEHIDMNAMRTGKPPAKNIFTSIPPFKNDENLAKRTTERLTTWRKEYMKGLYDSGLLRWMIDQPLVAIVGDALLVHGGVAASILSYVEKMGIMNEQSTASTLNDVVNVPFREFFGSRLDMMKKKRKPGANSIKERLTEGFSFEIMLNLVQHRGYFKRDGCVEVDTIISKLGSENVNRISVGHTPRDYAEELCGGKLLATDSSLSKSFRAYGNHYCPLNEKYKNDAEGYSCSSRQVVDKCEGSISVLVRESADHEWPTNVKHLFMSDMKNDGSANDEL
jgi:hypothetical protein